LTANCRSSWPTKNFMEWLYNLNGNMIGWCFKKTI
jgi:hypothetical protein